LAQFSQFAAGLVLVWHDRAEGPQYVQESGHDRAEGHLYVQRSRPDRAENLLYVQGSMSFGSTEPLPKRQIYTYIGPSKQGSGTPPFK